MSGAVVMRPKRYMFIPPQMVKASEDYYEKIAKEESEDGISTGQRCFTRLALQRTHEPLTLEETPEHPIGTRPGAFYIPFMPRPSPREVHNASTKELLLRSDFMTSCTDGDAHGCFEGMARADDFFQKIFSIVPIKEPSRSNSMIACVHDPLVVNGSCWDIGDKRVHCGDFDPAMFSSSFARNPDTVVHEIGHAVTYYSSNFDYKYQSGAIDESLADIFAIMEKHYRTKKRAGDPDISWNIGEGLMARAREGNSLRSLSNPGFGFRGHPALGDDVQVGLMSEYHGDEDPADESHDFGGVHKYSGIANHAFYLAATQDGRHSWERMGKIWYHALTHSQHDIDFAGFAGKTIEAARELRFGDAITQIVAKSWTDVGVYWTGEKMDEKTKEKPKETPTSLVDRFRWDLPIPVAPGAGSSIVGDTLPGSDFRDSPKEVWNAITGEKLCWNEHLVSSDVEANQCYQIMIRVDRFFQEVFHITPINDPQSENLMKVYIHDPRFFDNSGWISVGKTVHCGDFDPSLFSSSFPANADIIFREFSHAVIYYLSNLDYRGQSGAICESLSDVFTIMAKHYRTKTNARAPDASWTIGEGLIAHAREGNSLRSMSHPGSAFRGHPLIGDDDQVGHMSDYHEEPMSYDFGGVHKYSGIANRAFYLAATQEGGFSWGKMGRIWYHSLTHSQYNIDFAGFAGKTVETAKELFGKAIAQIVANSWEQVGVRIDIAPPPSATSAPSTLGTPPRASEEGQPPSKRQEMQPGFGSGRGAF